MNVNLPRLIIRRELVHLARRRVRWGTCMTEKGEDL